jgi:hypothetical protein
MAWHGRQFKEQTMKFTYVTGGSKAVKAGVAGHELERIRSESNGQLHASTVVEESRAEDAPLHPVFEWDDGKAADEYRKNQARQLISSIRVVYESPDASRQSRMYVNVTTGGGRHYMPSIEAMADDELREQVLNRLLKMLNHYDTDLRELKGLRNIRSKVQSLISEIEHETGATSSQDQKRSRPVAS